MGQGESECLEVSRIEVPVCFQGVRAAWTQPFSSSAMVRSDLASAPQHRHSVWPQTQRGRAGWHMGGVPWGQPGQDGPEHWSSQDSTMAEPRVCAFACPQHHQHGQGRARSHQAVTGRGRQELGCPSSSSVCLHGLESCQQQVSGAGTYRC